MNTWYFNTGKLDVKAVVFSSLRLRLLGSTNHNRYPQIISMELETSYCLISLVKQTHELFTRNYWPSIENGSTSSDKNLLNVKVKLSVISENYRINTSSHWTDRDINPRNIL